MVTSERVAKIWLPGPYSYSISDEDGVLTLTNPNGTNTIYSYDERYRLKEVKHTGSTGHALVQVDYSPDGVGNRKEIWFDNNPTSKKSVYGYDEMNRKTVRGETDSP